MKKNIGTTDSTIRIVLGLFILSLIFWGPKTWFGLIGLIPILTVFIGYCPLYTLLGINTCQNKLPDTEPKTEVEPKEDPKAEATKTAELNETAETAEAEETKESK